MNTIIQYNKQTGIIVSSFHTNSSYDISDYFDENNNAIDFEGIVNTNKVYVKNNLLTIYPPKINFFSDWDGEQWVINIDKLKSDVLNIRLGMLIDSDWTDTLSAVERLGESKYQEWQTYRQALRDIPEQTGFPLNVVYPTLPN